MSPEDFEILQHMMNGAKPPEYAVRLLEDVCERTKLSWKARHVYLQKRRLKNGSDSWQAVLSIDGFRAVGARHPDYAGQEGPFFVTSADGSWTDVPPEGSPYAAKVGIRKRNGLTTWGVAKFKDYYAGMMWDKFPSTMTAKCAEMLAWRKTFPETFGGLYGDAEMEQALGGGESAKEKLHKMEVIDYAKEPQETPEEKEKLREYYTVRLQEAKSGDEVKALGAEIQAASKEGRLEEIEVMQLHMLYTKMKKKYS